MFCYALLCVHSSFAIISMGKRELVALLCLSSWCLVIVVCLFLAVPRVCLQFVIMVFPGHIHLLFLIQNVHDLYYFKTATSYDKSNENSRFGYLIKCATIFTTLSTGLSAILLWAVSHQNIDGQYPMFRVYEKYRSSQIAMKNQSTLKDLHCL